MLQQLRDKLPSRRNKADRISDKIYDLKLVSDRFRDGLMRGMGLEHKLRSDYRSYRGYGSGHDEKIRTRHTAKMVFSMVRAVVSELMGRPPKPKIKGRRVSHLIKSQAVGEYLGYQAEMARYFSPWMDSTMLKTLHGTSVMRQDWVQETYTYDDVVNTIEYDEELGLAMPRAERKAVTDIAYEGWKLFGVNLMNFFWDPYGTDMASCEWVIEVEPYFTQRDFMNAIRNGSFQLTTKQQKEIEAKYASELSVDRHHYREDYQTVDPERHEMAGSFPLMRYYTDEEVFYVLLPSDGVPVLLNRSREYQVNPFKMRHSHRKPYIMSKFWPLPGEFLGLGIGDMANSYQYYSSRALQIEMDQLWQNLTRRYIVRKNALADPDRAVDENNLIMWVRDMDGIRDLPPMKTMGAGIQLMDTIQKSAEEDLGINKILQGDRLRGVVSATEAAEVASQGRKQLSIPFFNHKEAVREQFKMALAYNYLFLDGDTFFFNGEEIQITPDMFNVMDLFVDVDESSMSANREALYQKKVEIVAQALEPHIPMGHINVKALDIARVAAAELDPRDFIQMDGEPAIPGNEEFVSKFVSLVQSKPDGGNPASAANGPAPSPENTLQGLNPNGQTGDGAPRTQMGDELNNVATGQGVGL